MQCNHSCVLQSQFRSSLCLARHWLGLEIWVMLVCSKQDLLDMWLLPVGMASPCWIRRCTRGLPFTQGFTSSELPEKPAHLPQVKLARQGLYFTGMIIWLPCLFPLWELQMFCYERMLWLILHNRHYKILKKLFQLFSSVQFSSVAQLCPTLCDPMSCRTPGLPVHHHLPWFTQTHVPGVGDAIQPSHPLSSPFPPAPNPSQHQSFQWVIFSNESTLHMRWPKYWSFSFSIIPSKETCQFATP